MNNFKSVLGMATCFVLGSLTVVGANQAIQAIQNKNIKISLNGRVQTFVDETTGEVQYPITYNNRTYLPLRNVAQLAGLSVDYDSSSNTAILKSNTTTNTTINNNDINYTTNKVDIDFDNIKLTSTKQNSNYSYFDNLNFYIAEVEETEKDKINKLAKNTALNYINLFNNGSTSSSEAYKSIISSEMYASKTLNEDIAVFYKEFKATTGNLELSNFELHDVFASDNHNLACYVTFNMKNDTISSYESLLLIYDDGVFKVLGDFAQDN